MHRKVSGANSGTRIRDIRLGKPMFYQLNYVRIWSTDGELNPDYQNGSLESYL